MSVQTTTMMTKSVIIPHLLRVVSKCEVHDVNQRERCKRCPHAAADCGFSTVVWAKFKSLAEGAEIATLRLWG